MKRDHGQSMSEVSSSSGDLSASSEIMYDGHVTQELSALVPKIPFNFSIGQRL